MCCKYLMVVTGSCALGRATDGTLGTRLLAVWHHRPPQQAVELYAFRGNKFTLPPRSHCWTMTVHLLRSGPLLAVSITNSWNLFSKFFATFPHKNLFAIGVPLSSVHKATGFGFLVLIPKPMAVWTGLSLRAVPSSSLTLRWPCASTTRWVLSENHVWVGNE